MCRSRVHLSHLISFLGKKAASLKSQSLPSRLLFLPESLVAASEMLKSVKWFGQRVRRVDAALCSYLLRVYDCRTLLGIPYCE